MMELEIFRDQNKKGLGTADIFNVIPVGKAGSKVTVPVYDGAIEFVWGSTIRDEDIRVGVLLLSYMLQGFGKEKLDKIRGGIQLDTQDENGQALYTTGNSVKGSDISRLLNNGDGKKGKRIHNSLRKLEHLHMHYHIEGSSEFTVQLFNRVSYEKGWLHFDVAHFLINRLGQTLLAFRQQPIIDARGREIRLALYVETHQRKFGTYKDEDGVTRTKYVPKNEYSLEELIVGMNMNLDTRVDKAVKALQEDFNKLKENNPNFPQFTYEPRRGVFESEYKNGIKNRRIK